MSAMNQMLYVNICSALLSLLGMAFMLGLALVLGTAFVVGTVFVSGVASVLGMPLSGKCVFFCTSEASSRAFADLCSALLRQFCMPGQH